MRTKIDNALLRKFERLMMHYGVTENSEMLRVCISELHRRVIEKDDEVTRLKEEFRAEIQRSW